MKRDAIPALGVRRARSDRIGATPTHATAAAGRSRRRPLVWASVTMLLVMVGTAVSFSVSAAVARGDTEKSRRAFEASSADIASTLKLAIQHEGDLVASASGFLLDNANPSNAEFRAWATTVHAGARYPELQGMATVVLVPR